MTQRDHILAHLNKGVALTPLEALDRWGTFRLAARILELRKQGYDIRSEPHITKHGARISKYTLKDPEQTTLKL